MHDILNINNVYFDNMVSQIYLADLQLYEVNTSVTKTSFLDLHLSISNDIVSTKIFKDFLALHPMAFIFLNSSDLLEHSAILLTSILAINC